MSQAQNPGADAGLLLGAKAIAAFLGVKPRQAYYLADTGRMPHFHMGRTLCAKKDKLQAWVAGMDEAAAPATAAEAVAVDEATVPATTAATVAAETIKPAPRPVPTAGRFTLNRRV